MGSLQFLGGMGVGLAIGAPWAPLQIFGIGQALLCLWGIHSDKKDTRP